VIAKGKDAMNIRVRFAPSPTGHIHIGNIRAAIFNWLFARHHNGKFLVRIEDTDAERSTPEAVSAIFEALEWLGMNYDEPPVYQSRRMDEYRQIAMELVRKNFAYMEDKGDTRRGKCIVFRMPGEDISFQDEIRGKLQKKAEDLKDFVILRSDGTPVFHLANVVDDIFMGITHVIRGDDHMENTFRHIALFRALGAEPPRYAHLPMIVNANGKPYSKRDGAAYVGEFRDAGFLPDALFNFLALLGWSPGNDIEIMTREQMIQYFDLARVKPSPARFDMKKLEWMNNKYICMLPLTRFVDYAKQAVSATGWNVDVSSEYFQRVCALLQSRTNTFDDIKQWGYFFKEEIDYDESAVQKTLKKPGMKDILSALKTLLETVDFTVNSIEDSIHKIEQAYSIPQGKLNFPIRIAITGISRGAGLYETMEILGKKRCIDRLNYAIANLCG
jgi:glutamyl-tRNA synthetase